jgi:hypothetical protein
LCDDNDDDDDGVGNEVVRITGDENTVGKLYPLDEEAVLAVVVVATGKFDVDFAVVVSSTLSVDPLTSFIHCRRPVFRFNDVRVSVSI